MDPCRPRGAAGRRRGGHVARRRGGTGGRPRRRGHRRARAPRRAASRCAPSATACRCARAADPRGTAARDAGRRGRRGGRPRGARLAAGRGPRRPRARAERHRPDARGGRHRPLRAARGRGARHRGPRGGRQPCWAARTPACAAGCTRRCGAWPGRSTSWWRWPASSCAPARRDGRVTAARAIRALCAERHDTLEARVRRAARLLAAAQRRWPGLCAGLAAEVEATHRALAEPERLRDPLGRLLGAARVPRGRGARPPPAAPTSGCGCARPGDRSIETAGSLRLTATAPPTATSWSAAT